MSLLFVKSELSSIKHAFFSRYGGVSQGNFAELNVAKHVPDEPESVDQNRLIALNHLKIDSKNFVFLGKLEHSNRIEQVNKAAGGMEFNNHDALITNSPGLALGLSVADCLPIILVDESAPALGLVHAGWRGLKVEVIRHTVEALKEQFSADPANIKAIIGPSIGPQSYEVGREVSSQFNERYSTHGNNKIMLDLWSIAEDQLTNAGIKQMENLKIDTFEDDRFYSSRRQDSPTGRFLAVASL